MSCSNNPEVPSHISPTSEDLRLETLFWDMSHQPTIQLKGSVTEGTSGSMRPTLCLRGRESNDSTITAGPPDAGLVSQPPCYMPVYFICCGVVFTHVVEPEK